MLPSRGVRRRTLTLTVTLTLTHTNRCSLHRVLRLTLTLSLRPRHPSIPPISSPPLPPLPPPSLVRAAATTQTPFSNHPSLHSPLHSPSLAFGILTRTPSLALSLPHSPSLALGLPHSHTVARSRLLLRRLPVTTPIRLSISGYHADSTHRAPRRSFIHPG